MSQREQVLKWMKSGKKITTYQAYTKFGCTRLPDRIRDLERDGYLIKRHWKKVRKGVQVRQYYMQTNVQVHLYR